jgi:hypothetical protein
LLEVVAGSVVSSHSRILNLQIKLIFHWNSKISILTIFILLMILSRILQKISKHALHAHQFLELICLVSDHLFMMVHGALHGHNMTHDKISTYKGFWRVVLLHFLSSSCPLNCRSRQSLLLPLESWVQTPTHATKGGKIEVVTTQISQISDSDINSDMTHDKIVNLQNILKSWMMDEWSTFSLLFCTKRNVRKM